MTAGCSINAMIRMAPAHWGHTSGSTSYTCLISGAHARFASEGNQGKCAMDELLRDLGNPLKTLRANLPTSGGEKCCRP
jgi:hypothetical protein